MRRNEVRQRLLVVFFFASIVLTLTARAFADVSRVTVDSRVSPTLGVDSSSPEFGWEISIPDAFDVRQYAYSIIVATTPEKRDAGRDDCWKSGIVNSDKLFGVRLQGLRLESSRRYYWRVTSYWRGVDADGLPIDGAEIGDGEFVTGILTPKEWDATWITAERVDADPLPILFKEFDLDQPCDEIQDAFLHVCGLGQQIVSVNDLRVGNRTSIDPGWTNYRKTCLYTTFDVKAELLAQREKSSISIVLGNGMYNVPGGRYVKFTGSFGLPKAIAKLVVRYQDGSCQELGTDGSWRAVPSPVVFSCVYGGDDVDFGRGVVSKNRILTFAESRPAVETDGPGGVLRAQIQPPVVELEEIQPVDINVLDDGTIEANFGYNFAGRPVFCAAPKTGDRVRVTLAEMPRQPWNGHFDDYLFNPKQESDVPTLETAKTSNASTPEALSSVFGYWGFQYAYFNGAEYQPDVELAERNAANKTQITKIYAERIGADLERVGSFDSDGASLNEIDLMIDRSIRSNIVSLMTDCPHREKLGWLEETHLMGPSILYRYDVHTLYRKICRDISEAQLENGMVPDIAPEYTRFRDGFFWSAEWSAATVQIPWLLYRWYGDEDIIATHYETMDRYVRYVASIRNDQGLVKAGLGDWYDWSPEKRHAGYSQHTPGELTAQAFLCDNARIMAFFADKLGKVEDARYYSELRAQAMNDFQKAYFDRETNVVATGSQASYAFALYFDLIPRESRQGAFENLLKELEKWEYRPSCGEVAWPFLIKTLANFGRNDVLWKIIQREDAPGYVHMLKRWGMKTLSETWDGPGSSMNHFMFGALQEWFSSDVVGIRQEDDSIAFSKILLRPTPMPGRISRAKGDYRSPYGTLLSDWRLTSEEKQFEWRVSVPASSSARLETPVASESSRVRVFKLDGERSVETTDWKSTFTKGVGENMSRRSIVVGSGNYLILSDL